MLIKRVILFFMTVSIIVLNGCQLFDGYRRDTQSAVDASMTEGLNWSHLFSSLITEMLTQAGVRETSVVLISDVKNNTQQAIRSYNLSQIIADELAQQSQFTIVDNESIDKAKRKLGLSVHDRLVSRSKIISIGRYLSTDLVLFSSVDRWEDGSDITPKVTVELLSTKTGEIIWRQSSDQLFTMPTKEESPNQ